MSEQRNVYHHLIMKSPKGTRDDLMKVYLFVCSVNEAVATFEVDQKPLINLKKEWNKAKKTLATSSMRTAGSERTLPVRGMAYIVHRYSCDPAWIDTYIDTALSEAKGLRIKTHNDLLEHMYGSVECIGLVVANIAGIKDGYSDLARMQARAFGQAQLLRSCGEDSLNGKVYFPEEDLAMCGLRELSDAEDHKKQAEFREFIEHQAAYYRLWQREARPLLRKTPLRSRAVLGAAIDIHKWLVDTIIEAPMTVFEKKLSPSILRVTLTKVFRRLRM